MATIRGTAEWQHMTFPVLEFVKRVRDAERLDEGKEILRDALETLQTFDELMLARSTSEMHFFEYNEMPVPLGEAVR